MKRLLCIMISISMIVSVFSGCNKRDVESSIGGNSSEEESSSSDPEPEPESSSSELESSSEPEFSSSEAQSSSSKPASSSKPIAPPPVSSSKPASSSKPVSSSTPIWIPSSSSAPSSSSSMPSNTITTIKQGGVYSNKTYNNLIIHKDVEDDTVILENVKVTGKLIIEGGDKIELIDCTIEKMEANRYGITLPIIAEGKTTVNNSVIKSYAELHEDDLDSRYKGFRYVVTEENPYYYFIDLILEDTDLDKLTLNTKTQVTENGGGTITSIVNKNNLYEYQSGGGGGGGGGGGSSSSYSDLTIKGSSNTFDFLNKNYRDVTIQGDVTNDVYFDNVRITGTLYINSDVDVSITGNKSNINKIVVVKNSDVFIDSDVVVGSIDYRSGSSGKLVSSKAKSNPGKVGTVNISTTNKVDIGVKTANLNVNTNATVTVDNDLTVLNVKNGGVTVSGGVTTANFTGGTTTIKGNATTVTISGTTPKTNLEGSVKTVNVSTNNLNTVISGNVGVLNSTSGRPTVRLSNGIINVVNARSNLDLTGKGTIDTINKNNYSVSVSSDIILGYDLETYLKSNSTTTYTVMKNETITGNTTLLSNKTVNFNGKTVTLGGELTVGAYRLTTNGTGNMIFAQNLGIKANTENQIVIKNTNNTVKFSLESGATIPTGYEWKTVSTGNELIKKTPSLTEAQKLANYLSSDLTSTYTLTDHLTVTSLSMLKDKTINLNGKTLTINSSAISLGDGILNFIGSGTASFPQTFTIASNKPVGNSVITKTDSIKFSGTLPDGYQWVGNILQKKPEATEKEKLESYLKGTSSDEFKLNQDVTLTSFAITKDKTINTNGKTLTINSNALSLGDGVLKFTGTGVVTLPQAFTVTSNKSAGTPVITKSDNMTFSSSIPQGYEWNGNDLQKKPEETEKEKLESYLKGTLSDEFKLNQDVTLTSFAITKDKTINTNGKTLTINSNALSLGDGVLKFTGTGVVTLPQAFTVTSNKSAGTPVITKSDNMTFSSSIPQGYEWNGNDLQKKPEATEKEKLESYLKGTSSDEFKLSQDITLTSLAITNDKTINTNGKTLTINSNALSLGDGVLKFTGAGVVTLPQAFTVTSNKSAGTPVITKSDNMTFSSSVPQGYEWNGNSLQKKPEATEKEKLEAYLNGSLSSDFKLAENVTLTSLSISDDKTIDLNGKMLTLNSDSISLGNNTLRFTADGTVMFPKAFSINSTKAGNENIIIANNNINIVFASGVSLPSGYEYINNAIKKKSSDVTAQDVTDFLSDASLPSLTLTQDITLSGASIKNDKTINLNGKTLKINNVLDCNGKSLTIGGNGTIDLTGVTDVKNPISGRSFVQKDDSSGASMSVNTGLKGYHLVDSKKWYAQSDSLESWLKSTTANHPYDLMKKETISVDCTVNFDSMRVNMNGFDVEVNAKINFGNKTALTFNSTNNNVVTFTENAKLETTLRTPQPTETITLIKSTGSTLNTTALKGENLINCQVSANTLTYKAPVQP